MAALALLNSASAFDEYIPTSRLVYPLAFHINEDPNSVPSPLQGKPYMTSTQAKLLRNNQSDLSSEPKGVNPQDFQAYNKYSAEYVQLSADSEEEYSRPADDMTVLWMVQNDYGELDHTILNREEDIKNGEKRSGWTNPLGWHDDGSDDDLVV